MPARESDTAIVRTAIGAAFTILAATILSGPGAMLLIALTRPQPAWRDAATLAQHHHSIQALPYYLGLFLIGGFAVLLPCLHALAPAAQKARTGASLIFCGIAGALVFQNYVLQTTFVPHLARHYTPASAPLIAAFSMVNPSSLAWGLEMWGYGFLGVATWLCAGVFREPGLERLTSRAFVLNGWLSILGAIATALSPGWVMTTAGLLAFGLWNLLVVIMIVLVLLVLRGGLR